jgi:calcineurin-like phosphoesterase family protein
MGELGRYEMEYPNLTPKDTVEEMFAPIAFLISDTHFDHENIIKYQKRPFPTLGCMNYELERRWNAIVRPEDTVYMLGDLAFKHPRQWLRRLNGNIIYINGNHGDKGVADYLVMHFEGTQYLLIHDPINVPEHYDGWVIHGHHHADMLDDYPLINPKTKSVNVSVELTKYAPVPFSQIHKLVKQNKRVMEL